MNDQDRKAINDRIKRAKLEDAKPKGPYFKRGQKVLVQIIRPPEIPGAWVYTTCEHIGATCKRDCKKIVGHWSKTGELQPERKYLCERHR